MLSPSFECSPHGLRSAVRLRAVVHGHADPDGLADAYMANLCPGEQTPEGLRDRILLVIGEIEHLTSAYPNS